MTTATVVINATPAQRAVLRMERTLQSLVDDGATLISATALLEDLNHTVLTSGIPLHAFPSMFRVLHSGAKEQAEKTKQDGDDEFMYVVTSVQRTISDTFKALVRT